MELHHGRVRLDNRKNIIPRSSNEAVERHELHREVESPSLEMFKKRTEVTLRDTI